LLANSPEEQLGRKLQRRWKAHQDAIVYAYVLFTEKRPKHLAVVYVLATLMLMSIVWADLTILSFVFLSGGLFLWAWWFSEHININVPWEKILTETEQSEPFRKDAFDFIAKIQMRGELGFQQAKERVELRLTREKPWKNFGKLLFLIIFFEIFPGTLLLFTSVYFLILSPKLLEDHWLKTKEKQKKEM